MTENLSEASFEALGILVHSHFCNKTGTVETHLYIMHFVYNILLNISYVLTLW